MILLAASAVFVGLVHSLSPGHWLPVVLTVKSRRWPLRTALAGALTAASGHVLVSVSLGVVSIVIGSRVMTDYEDSIERYGSLILISFGLIYAALAYFRHASCHGHGHHGPVFRGSKAPFLFLFSLGLSPCVAALPLFIAASALGNGAAFMTMVGFSCGVIAALTGATLLVSRGLLKLDHPLLDHYGDVITGLGVSLMGVILLFAPI